MELSKEQQEMLNALAAKPDNAIDFSDIPATTADNWKGALRGFTPSPEGFRKLREHFRPVKKSITIRVDADVLAYFDTEAAGYQTRINAALREYMETHLAE
jgi:uncharacterized protein (DUF4415 family)